MASPPNSGTKGRAAVVGIAWLRLKGRSLKSWSLTWRQYAIPVAILVAGLVFTAAAAVTAHHFVRLRDQEHFERLQAQALRSIDHSFDGYAAVLRGVAGVVNANGSPDLQALRTYLPTAGVPGDYPGLRSVGLIWWLGPDALPGARAQAALALKSNPDAQPPTGESATLFNYPLRATTPKNLGSDLYAEPARRGAMTLARRTGAPRLSQSLNALRPDTKSEPHLLLFLPIDRVDPDASAGRRFLGWAFASFRNEALFRATLSELGYLSEISVRVYDGAEQPQKLLYASGAGTTRSDLDAVVAHEVDGRRWLVRFGATDKFDAWPITTTILPAVAAGIAITLSLSFASWLQAVGLARALRAEAEAKAARDRSELLMNEVNHRVANSLQLVSTLVSMQADQVSEPVARDALNETRSRIMAVARVHQRLYASGDVARVALKPYLESLVSGLGAGAPPGVRLTLNAHEVAVATDVAVSVGVVAAELVTNALKYAYPGGSGEVRVGLRGQDGEAVLSVEDDGVGAPIAQASSTGLGMRIVTAMTQGLRGQLSVEAEGSGRRVQVRFPLR